MSAEKRKFILLGFAGLAVVLVAVIAIVSPSFRSEDATGAIGAVQKHRAPQIAKQDVILGNEQVRQQQKVLFADYLNDAATLKAISGSLAGDRANVQARINAAQRDVESRFREDIEALNLEMRSLADEDALTLGSRKTAILGDIDAVMALGRAAQLDSKQMAGVAVRLQNVAEQDLGISRFSTFKLNDVETANLDGVRAALNRFDVADRAQAIQVRCDYLGAMAKESQMLADVGNDVMALNERDVQALGVRLNEFAATLDQRAQANVQTALAAESDDIASLGRMSQSMSTVDSRSFTAAQKAQYDACIRDLNKQSAAARADLSAIASIAENRSLASMLNDSDAFVAQARSLAEAAVSLESRHKK